MANDSQGRAEGSSLAMRQIAVNEKRARNPLSVACFSGTSQVCQLWSWLAFRLIYQEENDREVEHAWVQKLQHAECM